MRKEINWVKTGGVLNIFEMASRIIKGKTLLEKTLSDLSASIDFVVSRQEIDKKRVGLLVILMVEEWLVFCQRMIKRAKVSIANCYARLLKSLDIKKNTRIPMELVVPNILKFGDFSDFLKLSNNCNVLLSVSKKDKWVKMLWKYTPRLKNFLKKRIYN